MTQIATRVFVLAVFAVTLSATAQIALKAGMSDAVVQYALRADAADLSWSQRILTVARNALVMGGLFLYGVSALVWLLVLARLDVSVAYPFVGLGFIITMIAGRVLFDEPVTFVRVLGTLLVCCGVALVAGSNTTR